MYIIGKYTSPMDGMGMNLYDLIPSYTHHFWFRWDLVHTISNLNSPGPGPCGERSTRGTGKAPTTLTYGAMFVWFLWHVPDVWWECENHVWILSTINMNVKPSRRYSNVIFQIATKRQFVPFLVWPYSCRIPACAFGSWNQKPTDER